MGEYIMAYVGKDDKSDAAILEIEQTSMFSNEKNLFANFLKNNQLSCSNEARDLDDNLSMAVDSRPTLVC